MGAASQNAHAISRFKLLGGLRAAAAMAFRTVGLVAPVPMEDMLTPLSQCMAM